MCGRSKQLIDLSLIHSSQEPGDERKGGFHLLVSYSASDPTCWRDAQQLKGKVLKETCLLLFAFQIGSSNVAAVWRLELAGIFFLSYPFRWNCSFGGKIMNYWSWKIPWVPTGFIRPPVRHNSTLIWGKSGQSPKKHLRAAWPTEHCPRTGKTKDTTGLLMPLTRIQTLALQDNTFISL